MTAEPVRAHETSPTEWLQCCGGAVVAVLVFNVVAAVIAAFLWVVAALTIVFAVVAFVQNLLGGKSGFNDNEKEDSA